MREIRSNQDVEFLANSGVRQELVEVAARKLQNIFDAFALLNSTYDPDIDGPIVLVEPTDDFSALTGLGTGPLVRGLAEHVERHDAAAAWEIIVCPSNSWAWTYLVPDDVSLPQDVTAELARQASRQDLIPRAGELAPF